MIGLDTNVVVRYLVGDDIDQARRATSVFEALTVEQPGFLSLVTLAETFWVLTRTYNSPPRQAVALLTELISSDELVCQCYDQARAALRQAANGADLGDALFAAACNEAGCAQVVSFDKKAARLLGWRNLSIS